MQICIQLSLSISIDRKPLCLLYHHIFRVPKPKETNIEEAQSLYLDKKYLTTRLWSCILEEELQRRVAFLQEE